MNAPFPQAAALNAFADANNWTRLQVMLNSIITRANAVERRLKAFPRDAAATVHLERVRYVRRKARGTLADPCAPSDAGHHLGFYGPNGRGPAVDYTIELAGKAADYLEASR